MELLYEIGNTTLATILDILPIALILSFFQFCVLRTKPPNLDRLLIGFAYVLIGLSLFLVGLKQALFPLGDLMAEQLTDPDFIEGEYVTSNIPYWPKYFWVYVFAGTIGFATTIAEPSLIAVAIKASSVSGGTISVWGLRLTVAIGVAIGVTLGVYRIISGTALHYYIAAGYAVVVIQTIYSNRDVVPLAYDTGGVTTSTVTVPIITALGLGLASTIPGRNPVMDGFGLIAFASLFPVISVLAYAQISSWHRKRSQSRYNGEKHET